MAHLLHVDTSANPTGSVTREVTAAFATAWQEANPAGAYTHRDLTVNPVPHVDAAFLSARQLPADQHTAEQRASWTVAKELIDELIAADTILIGAPMYNFSIPSSLKAWLDRIIVPAIMPDPQTGEGPLVGKRVVAVTARGGSYAPGTPREDFDFQEPYLKAVLGYAGLGHDLTFVHTEMTLAHAVPQLAQFKEFAVQSRSDAHDTVRTLAYAA
jgi:FMN-dependent NADH-azoreductase